MLIGGTALLQLEDHGDLHMVGKGALVLCVLFVVVGFYRYHTLRRQLDRLYPKYIIPTAQATP
ncbi:MAG: hypothetical protein ACOH13_11095 [Flavobacteriales bacterium]